MADAEQEAPVGSQAAPQPEVIDLDELPERKYLEASGIWVRKDKLEETVIEKYRRVLRVLANGATPRTPLRQELEDFYIAAAKATSGKLIDRHNNRWGTAITKARIEAKKQLQAAEEHTIELLGKLGKRQEDVNALGGIEARATTRYDKACEGYNRAAALIKDLKTQLEAEF